MEEERLAGRTLSLNGSRALRFWPRREKAVFLMGLEWALGASGCSHGKPGGEEGGVEKEVVESEKMALLLSEDSMLALVV